MLPAELPEQAGVLVVCCPKTEADFHIIAIQECENLKLTASEHALGWASHCNGYLSYMVYVSNDTKRRRSLIARIEAS